MNNFSSSEVDKALYTMVQRLVECMGKSVDDDKAVHELFQKELVNLINLYLHNNE